MNNNINDIHSLMYLTRCHLVINNDIHYMFSFPTDQSTVTDILVDDKPLTGNESVLLL